MFTAIGKRLLVAALVLLALGFVHGTANATVYTYTLDSVTNAGDHIGQTPYVGILNNATGVTTVLDPATAHITTLYGAGSNSAQYWAGQLGIADWKLVSAGNPYASPLKPIAVTSDFLTAGNWRISVADDGSNQGGFTYQSWSDETGGTYYGKYEWYLSVQTPGGAYPSLGDGAFPTLVTYANRGEALNHNFGSYIDVTMPAGGGRLNFWIWDDNSIDNFGTETIRVASLPLPPSLLLLLSALPLSAIPRIRRRITG